MSNFWDFNVWAWISLTAILFGVEALGLSHNLLPVILVCILAYAIPEAMGEESIGECVLERRKELLRQGKDYSETEERVSVEQGSFAVGKEPRDILWPPACQVLSMRDDENDDTDSYVVGALQERMILRLNFTTYDPDETARELCAILGEQRVYDEAAVIDEQVGPRLSERIPGRK